MRPDSHHVHTDVHQLRHDAFSLLTVIQSRTQLLQRQLRRMDGFSDEDRQRLDEGLVTILDSVQALCPTVDHLAAIAQRRDHQ